MSVRIVDVGKAKSVEEAFDIAQMNWVPCESEMINASNGKVIEGKKVIYRSDNNAQLGVVGFRYGVISNVDCFSFFNIICQKYGASICKISEYNGGATVHLEAEVLDKTFAINVGDECGFRFSLWNSFDGLHKAVANFGILRKICSNGLIGLGKDATSIAIRHTANAVSRLDQAIKVWSGGEKWYNEFVEGAKLLNQKMVDNKMVEKFLDELFGESDSGINLRKKEKVEELFVSGKGNHGKTAWDLYNGAIEYFDHFSKDDVNERMEFVNLGQGVVLKAKAFELALSM